MEMGKLPTPEPTEPTPEAQHLTAGVAPGGVPRVMIAAGGVLDLSAKPRSGLVSGKPNYPGRVAIRRLLRTQHPRVICVTPQATLGRTFRASY